MHVRIALSISSNREVKFCPCVVNQIKPQLNDSQLAVGRQVPVWLPPKDYKSQHAARWASTAPPLPRWPARGRRSRHRLLSMLLSWARNGNRLLVAWRRVRGLGVRGEAGEAAWTACVLPRQALRAAGEKAGPLGLIPAPGPRAPGSRPDSASAPQGRVAYPRTQTLPARVLRPRGLPGVPFPTRAAAGWARPPLPPRESPRRRPSTRTWRSACLPEARWPHAPALKSVVAPVELHCFCCPAVRAPRNPAPAHFSDLSVVCSLNRDVPPTGLPLFTEFPLPMLTPFRWSQSFNYRHFSRRTLNATSSKKSFLIPSSNHIFLF